MATARDTNSGKTTVKIDLESRDILRLASFQRRMTMADLLAELVAPLADDLPYRVRRPKGGKSSPRKRARSLPG